MNDSRSEIAERIFDELSARLRGLKSLSPAERELIRRCCADAVELQLRAMAAPDTPEARVMLLREKAHLHAQLHSLSAVAAARVSKAFWESVRSVVNAGVAIAFAAI